MDVMERNPTKYFVSIIANKYFCFRSYACNFSSHAPANMTFKRRCDNQNLQNWPIQYGRECCKWLKKRLILWVHWRSNFNSFSAGPYKRRTCTVYGTVYDFADSYLRFGACYVDENTTIRLSETISPNSYR
jgi:hypothetical protein